MAIAQSRLAVPTKTPEGQAAEAGPCRAPVDRARAEVYQNRKQTPHSRHENRGVPVLEGGSHAVRAHLT